MVGLPVESSCKPTSKASLSVSDRDVVKQLRYWTEKLDLGRYVVNKTDASLNVKYNKQTGIKMMEHSFFWIHTGHSLTMPEWLCLRRMAWPYSKVRWPPPWDDWRWGRCRNKLFKYRVLIRQGAVSACSTVHLVFMLTQQNMSPCKHVFFFRHILGDQ